MINLGHQPNYILGDLDSLTLKPEDYGCELITLPEQSKSDLEKGLAWCLDKGIIDITLVGFSGLRDDHSTVALFSLRTFSEKMNLKMITNFSSIYCKNGPSILKTTPGQLVSIFAIQSNTSILTNGLEYELNNEKLLSPGNGISNIAITNNVEIDSNDWVWIFINHME